MLMSIGNLALYPVSRHEDHMNVVWQERGSDEVARQENEKTVKYVFCALWCGVMFGQAALVAVWLGLGPPGALVRVVAAAAAYLVLGGAFMAGLLWREYTGGDYFGTSRQAAPFFGLPIFIVTAAAPLWLLRFFFGWHIRDESRAAPSHTRQFSIGHLMVLTALMAVLMGAAMEAYRRTEDRSLPLWLDLGRGWAATLVLSTAMLIPAALLLSRHLLLGIGIIMVVTAGILGVVIWFILAFIKAFGSSPSDAETWAVIGFAACPFFGFLVTLCLPLVAVRLCGYRLVMDEGRTKDRDGAGWIKVLSTKD